MTGSRLNDEQNDSRRPDAGCRAHEERQGVRRNARSTGVAAGGDLRSDCCKYGSARHRVSGLPRKGPLCRPGFGSSSSLSF